MSKVGIIIQARLNSSRLPYKVMAQIGGRTALERVVQRAVQIKEVDTIIIATPERHTSFLLWDTVQSLQIDYPVNLSIGPENDVLGRYVIAAKEHEIDIVIRITSDCPCIDPYLGSELLKTHLRWKPDCTRYLGYPDGVADIEIFPTTALERIAKKYMQPYHRTHVCTPFYYSENECYHVNTLRAKGMYARNELRVTLDYPEDLYVIRELYGALTRYDEMPVFSTSEVIDFLDANPKVTAINKDCKSKGVKEC